MHDRANFTELWTGNTGILPASLFGFDDYIYSGFGADIYRFVPWDAVAPPAAAAFQDALARAFFVGGLHNRSLDDIAPMWRVGVAFVAAARRKCAASGANAGVVIQRFTNRFAPPSSVKRSRQGGSNGCGGRWITCAGARIERQSGEASGQAFSRDHGVLSHKLWWCRSTLRVRY
jgi:hypothetical protein